MKGVLVKVEQKQEKWFGRDKRIIYLFVRGLDKKRYTFKDPKFEPYCYFRRGVLNISSFPKSIRKHQIVDREGKSYLKVWTYFPDNVRSLRRVVEHKYPFGVSVFEGDVRFPLRYIIDKKIRASVEWDESGLRPIEEDLPSNLRIFLLDIETIFDTEIKCLTIWDSYDELYHTFYWDKSVIPLNPESNWKLYHFPREEDMLRKVCEFIRKRNPDVITGFNIDFDLVTISDRADKLQIGKAWDSINPLGYSLPAPRQRRKKFRDFWISGRSQRIPGRAVIDLLEILLKTEKHQLSEFNLNYIARNYLKPPMEKDTWHGLAIGPNIDKIWPEEPEAVLRYNKHDAEIEVALNKQYHLIEFADEIRKFAGCQLEDIFSNKRIAHVELLRKTKKPLPVTKKEKRRYRGAIVIEPKKGIYKWILVMDFRSLYPSIIIQLNIDPDTYISTKERKKYNITTAYILKDPDSGSEFWFKKSPEGDLPSILRNYIEKREKKKEELKRARREKNYQLAEIYDVQQFALKVIANAFYGNLLYRGMPSAFQCARAVTACARMAIRFARDVIEKMGYTVIYGDTDSIMISSKFTSYNKCVEEAEWISQKVGKEIPKFLSKIGAHGKSYLDLALDKVFKHFLIDEKKKRYAGIPITRLGEGKLEIKGFGAIRSDASKFTKDLQKVLIKEVLRGREKEVIKYIVENLLDTYDKLPLTEIGVPCIFTKPLEDYKVNAIQKKAISNSNTYLKTKYKVGDKPKRIYVEMIKEKRPLEVVEDVDVVAYHTDTLKLPKWLKIDYPKMVLRTVKPKIQKILVFIGLDWKDIKLKPNLRIKKKKKKKRRKKKK